MGGQYVDAERIFRETIGEARELENSALLLAPTINLASLLAQTGRASEGRELAREGLDLARLLKNADAEILAASLIADADYQMGRLTEAIDALQDLVAEAKARMGGETRLGMPLRILAQAHCAAGNLSAAARAADEAVEHERKLERRVNLANSLLNRAQVQAQLAQWKQAEDDLREIEGFISEEGEALRNHLPRVRVVRAEVDLMRGQYEQAWQLLLAMQPAEGTSEDVRVAVPALVATCQAEIGLRKYDRAERSCRRALGHPRAPAVDRTWARIGHARALAEGGHPAEAEAAARRALDEAESMGALWMTATAAAVLLSCGRFVDDEALQERGRQAAARFLNELPSERRPAVMRRVDVREVLDGLGLEQTTSDREREP